MKRGLRNADGTGVLAGMTNISNVHGYVVSDGEQFADDGLLRLREFIDLYDLCSATLRAIAVTVTRRYATCSSWASCPRRMASSIISSR